MRKNLQKKFSLFACLPFFFLLTLSLNAAAVNDAGGLLSLNFRSMDKKAADELIKLKDTIKITSNAHSNDAAALGIIFNWNVKQKDDGILTVAALPDDSYYSFDLIVQSSGAYTIAHVDGVGAYEVAKNGKNINMVYIANAVMMPGGYLEFHGSEAIGVYYNDSAVYAVNANRLAVATLWLEIASGTPRFAGLNDFTVLDAVFSDGLYRVTLGYLVAGGNGFTGINAGLLKISGAAGVEILRARLVGYDENGGAVDFDCYVEKDTGGIIIPPGDDDPPIVDTVNYDLNNDGVVEQLDLAIALSYFTANIGDVNWNDAEMADFNDDGIVDIEDFIRLINNNMTF